MGSKQHIDGRPAQVEKLLGDPVAVQSPAAMVLGNLRSYLYNFATLKSFNTFRCSYSHEPVRVEVTSCGR